MHVHLSMIAGLRAGHMEGHLILARDLAQTCDVVQNDIVQRAQEEAFATYGLGSIVSTLTLAQGELQGESSQATTMT